MKRQKPSRAPTIKTLELLTQEGWYRQGVQYWNPFAHIFQDLFGCIDIIAVHPEVEGVLGIQVTTAVNKNSRLRKAIQQKELYAWLRSGNYFVVAGWEMIPWGKTHKWICQWWEIKLDDYVRLTNDPSKLNELGYTSFELFAKSLRILHPLQSEERILLLQSTTA
jgi:hypothetical protein